MSNVSDRLVSWLANVLNVDLLELSAPEDPAEYIRQYDGDNAIVDGTIVAEDSASAFTLIVDEIEQPKETIRHIMDSHGLHALELLDPVRGVESIRDDPDTLYVWKLDQDVGADYVDQFAHRIEEVHDGPPKAMHMFARGMDELKEYSHTAVEHELLPWLADAKAMNGEVE